jgi:leucine-rich repeat protein SHOC2
MGGSIVTEEELEIIIEKARIDRATELDLCNKEITILPESIGNLAHLTKLCLENNSLSYLPESIGDLSNLTHLFLGWNSLSCLPESIGNLRNLTHLFLSCNYINSLPDRFSKLHNLVELELGYNNLDNLPKSMISFSNLIEISLNANPIDDFSILQALPKLDCVEFLGFYPHRRYWTKLSEWSPKWLLDEENAEVRRVLIQQIGYDRICQELDAIDLDTWREYTLLKITADIDEEPMVLLKMTCPSTGHIHILRVPPEMTSAEAAITWVNHGIHPDEFSVQT